MLGKRSLRLRLIVPVVVTLALAGAAGQYLRPIPATQLLSTVSSSIRIPGKAPRLPWPTAGEAAVDVDGVGTIGSFGGNQPEPIGSVAKIMTALLVVKTHPVGVGLPGPELTITPQDVATYLADLAGQQSVVPVVAGEQLSELQALQALLIPSGNNIATLLADWDAGSEATFVAQMNQEAARLGMHHTHYADASGLSAETVSTAVDQTALAEAAMADSTFSSIVALAQATLPIAGVVYNVNAEVTHDGFVGVKTGSTPEAGGCFVFAAQRGVAGHVVTVVGAVLGQGGVSELDTALGEGKALVDASFSDLTEYTVVPRGGQLASLSQPWTKAVSIGAPSAIGIVGWPGLVVRTEVTSNRLTDRVAPKQLVGDFHLEVGQASLVVPLRAPVALMPPTLRWRLTRL
ncbi:MAG TPA: D-alanyl-D-alanine carboxypeptidase [Candidatus Dormibacteraeota bacterium]|nr:D-alanyl-D-alanine carboxypeptidase [Candidatus Dormibacteraeota bacterium]